MPGLEHPEQILPLLGQRFLPGALYIIVAGALISAILSTVDTTLLVCSSLVSHNIIVAARPQMSEAAKVRVARGGVVTFGIVAYVIALHAEECRRSRVSLLDLAPRCFRGIRAHGGRHRSRRAAPVSLQSNGYVR